MDTKENSHTLYKDMNYYRDVLALCKHFGIEIPREFDQFVQNDQT
jgi:hypothetical protein